ncbi:trimeric intracellular cation channel family protein [Corynebacterium halotolerans]|uniref:Glycine transporter domain-containing protein n=1 Tax=Corynebacterium halotolerans YIM 70093 = DSM 44683 TaxID=1121362 RepID=M1NQ67_9CORY|nr:trimeric intracellular cation channel family protein [Corynebacterium halotolerans]AGF71647.1 hypothetical protein A605_03170 [Corynebacterium halotolerans YIM 70093 = DSM 44683]
MDTAQLMAILFVIGITCEAMTAALSAGRQKMDLFGVMALAALTGLGGGTIRDIILDSYPLTWVEQPIYLLIVLGAALITVSLSFLMHYFRTLFLVLDAIGLSVFAVIGTRVALELGNGYVIACVAAVINGVSGGVLRDLMSDRVPLVFSRELYASIAVLATTVYMGLLWLGVDENITIVVTLLAAFTTRLIAIYFRMGLPVFEYRGADQPMDPRLRLSVQLMRRGLRKARRRTGFDAARYALLNRRHDRRGRRGRPDRSGERRPSAEDRRRDEPGREQRWPPGPDGPTAPR